MKTRYVVAWYEIDRAFGGREEGGWYYDTGILARTIAVFPTKQAAWAAARRANRLFSKLYKGRSVGSVLYSGGFYQAQVYANTAPAFYPEQRPRYE